MKERAKRINYAEVDSDVDLDDQDQQLERRRTGSGGEIKEKKSGDTYGTTGESTAISASVQRDAREW